MRWLRPPGLASSACWAADRLAAILQDRGRPDEGLRVLTLGAGGSPTTAVTGLRLTDALHDPGRDRPGPGHD